MAETYNFDYFQIPAVGFSESDLTAARTDANISIRYPASMKMSNFGALNVGARMSSDHTRTSLAFKAKGESEDWAVITADTGVGNNVKLKGVSVNHNPHVWGDSIKFVRDDQFIRMTMSNDNEGAQIDAPKFDVMDTNERSLTAAQGISQSFKNWPSEGWRSFGGKYDFPEAYVG